MKTKLILVAMLFVGIVLSAANVSLLLNGDVSFFRLLLIFTNLATIILASLWLTRD
jgi:hypothetical protein